MSTFEESRWADSEFSQNYRDGSDVYLPFRREFIEITKSFYACFIDGRQDAAILDLGCGDGLFIHELSSTFSPKSITLVDGSDDMLKAAENRLGKKSNLNFIQASFQDLLDLENEI